MNKRMRLILVVVLLSSFLAVIPAQASHVDAFTFFIPYRAEELGILFDDTHTRDLEDDDIIYVISFTVQRDGETVYYDHWEDGYEPNITDPIQPSTEVMAGDTGDVFTFRDTVVLPRADPPPPPYDHDGGDRIVATGGAIAVTLTAWPETPSSLFAGAWELYPTSRWGTDYRSPLGQDLERWAVPQPPPAPPPTHGNSFGMVTLNVQAIDDGTTVTIDLDGPGGAGSFQVTLDEGEQYNSIVDRPPNGRGIATDVGARVTSSEPVQVHLFTGDPSQADGDYEARAYSLIPFDQWQGSYLASRGSDTDFWLYNPNGGTLSVTAQLAGGGAPVPIDIPGGTTVQYIPDPANRALETGIFFTSGGAGNFYGVGAAGRLPDRDFSDRDWGYTIQPIANLTTQALVGWAPGNNNVPPSSWGGNTAGLEASRVYITAAADTTIFVDYQNTPAVPVASFAVTALQELDITDPVDYDMTGARIYTSDGTPFIAVWGQDISAPIGQPSIDVGTNIVPLKAPAIQKTYTIIEEGFGCGTVQRQYTARFQLQAFNDSDDPLDAIVLDQLGPELTYLPNTTTLDGVPVPDNAPPDSPFPLDVDGGGLPVTLGGFPADTSELIVNFDAQVPGPGEYANLAGFLTGTVFDPQLDVASVDVTVLEPPPAGYDVTKTLVDPTGGLIQPGQVVSFNLSIENIGATTITELPLVDEFDPNVLTFDSASVPPTITSTGVITWADLTATFGSLDPGDPPINMTLSFTVADPLPTGTATTVNIIYGAGVLAGDGEVVVAQPVVCDEAILSFSGAPSGPRPPGVPEPATVTLFGLGLAGLAGYARARLRRKKDA